MSELPPDIAARLDLLERLVAEQAASPLNLVAVKAAHEKKMQDKARLQGLGEAVENPNLHVRVKYPAWKYHASQPPVIVQNAREADGLGPGWFDSPAEVIAAGPEAVIEHRGPGRPKKEAVA